MIDGNEVHHLKTGSSESLVVNGNVTNFRITHNVVHDNNNIGIDVIGFERTAPDPAVDQARDGVVSGNLVYNITSRGNPAYGNEENSDGIYVDGGTRILIEQNVMHDVDFGIELASEHKDRATSYITARNNLIYHCHTAGVSIGGYAPERGHTDHCTVVNNTLYENDTSGTGSGEFQMQWNMADDIFANNIVYAGPRCLITVNKSQVDKSQPPVAIDHNLYYCASGAKASTWAGGFRHRDRIRQICSVNGRMTVIPVFSIRILLTLPRTTFICDQILPRSLLARLTECRWENWTLKAHRGSSPER